MRGSRYVAPMSAPHSPTFGKMKPNFAFAAAMRMSHAHAITAPAPTATPLIAPMIGRRHARIARDQPPGRARERDERRRVAAEQVLDDVVLIAARAEAAAAAGDHDRAHVVVRSSCSNVSASSR